MSIRGGGRPRDQAHRLADGSYEGSDLPTWRASDGRGGPNGRRPNRGKRRGIPGILKFLVFAGVLGTVVVVAGLTALRPLVRAAVVGWAWDNPGSLRISFVADFIREDLEGQGVLDKPASTDTSEEVFEVQAGDTPQALAPRLEEAGLIASQRAFIFTAVEKDLAPKLQTGMYLLRHDMTPAEVVDALVTAKITITTVDVGFREGLRIEQMAAKLQTVESGVDPQAFYDLATHPTPELIADYPWLQANLPEGRSLEGFLYPATYTLVTAANGGPFEVTTAEALIRMMLDRFQDAVGEARMTVPEARGLSFYEILTLASIVEREAVLDDERPLIAGVYQNRLSGIGGSKMILNADPTVLYAVDTMKLRDLEFAKWIDYFFWSVPEGGLGNVTVSEDLKGYQTYKVRGLVPGPICTPTVASIDAALNPNTATGYLFFLAIPDGSGKHVFAKTLEEHNQNKVKYGYQ